MAPRSYTQNAKWLNRDTVTIEGYFLANGSSAITNNATNIVGMGFSVAYVSTGLYDITVSEKFDHLLSIQLTLQLATVNGQFAQFVSWTPSTKKLRVRVVDDAGAVEDLAASDAMHFSAKFSKTAQKPTYGV